MYYKTTINQTRKVMCKMHNDYWISNEYVALRCIVNAIKSIFSTFAGSSNAG